MAEDKDKNVEDLDSEIAESEDESNDDCSEDELVEQLKQDAEENYNKYVRAVADLENFKKRALKEKSELLKYGGEGVIRDILEVYDSLRLAVTQDTKGDIEDFLKGVSAIFDQFNSVFEKHQIRKEESVGANFDPEKHEAVAMIPSEEQAPGTVIEEFKTLFYYKDKLLRPAQVVVVKDKES